MNKNIVNVIILIIGVVLLVLAVNEMGTFSSKASRALGGGLSNQVLAYFIVGGACTAYGLLQILKKK